jgi:hypothetical protein
MKLLKLVMAGMILLSAGWVSAQSMTLALEGEEWKSIKDYPVKGKNKIFSKESLTFGDYKTLEVDRSWTKGTQATSGITVGIPTDEFYKKLITTDHISRKQTLYFAMGDKEGNQSKAYSLAQLDAKDFNIGNSPVSAFNLLLDLAGPGVKSANISYSKIYVGPSAEGWELLIDNQAAQAKPKKYIGYFAKNNDEYYTVIPTSRVKDKKGKTGSMPFGSAGFEIRNKDGQPVAAVSLIDNGVIYLMDVAPEERLLLATACTALLLRPTDL